MEPWGQTEAEGPLRPGEAGPDPVGPESEEMGERAPAALGRTPQPPELSPVQDEEGEPGLLISGGGVGVSLPQRSCPVCLLVWHLVGWQGAKFGGTAWRRTLSEDSSTAAKSTIPPQRPSRLRGHAQVLGWLGRDLRLQVWSPGLRVRIPDFLLRGAHRRRRGSPRAGLNKILQQVIWCWRPSTCVQRLVLVQTSTSCFQIPA